MILTLAISTFLIVLILAVKRYRSGQFHTEVKALFEDSKAILGRTFNYGQLSGLPEPVQLYFKRVLKEGQPYISYARITHNGQFKSGPTKEWVDIKGEQYATTAHPGFIWKGTTSLFTARDMYISDKGRLTVALFGLIKIVDGKGASYNQGELLRWLGESVLYPTNLLPSQQLQWSAIDALTAKFTFSHKVLKLYYTVRFNEAGEITEMETERYMDKDHVEFWIIKMANYREMNDVRVPTDFEVIWRLKQGDLSYAKFHMQKVEYDIPKKF